MLTPNTLNFAIAAMVVLTPLLAPAQSSGMMSLMPISRPGDTNRPAPIQALIESAYTGPGQTEFLGVKRGRSGAFNAGVNLFAPLPLSENWIIPLGLNSQNISLDSASDAPVPNNINTLSLTTGLGYRLNEDWMIMGMVSPALYKFSDLGGNDLGFSGGANALWRYSPTLSLSLGVMVSPDSDLKVLPMIGVDWQFNDKWDLRLMFPQPRLTYQIDDHLRCFIGANMVGTTFRASDNFGSAIGRPQYNDALGTYRDIRIGAGAGYRFNQVLSLEAEAGCSASRQLDFTRVGETVRFDPAPYIRLGLNLGF